MAISEKPVPVAPTVSMKPSTSTTGLCRAAPASRSVAMPETTRLPGSERLDTMPLVGFGATSSGLTAGPVRSTVTGTSSTGPHSPRLSWEWTNRWCTPSLRQEAAAGYVVQVSPLGGPAGRVPVSATTVADRLSVIAMPWPAVPTVSRNISAPSMLPPASPSSPVAVTTSFAVPLAGEGLTAPARVEGPVFGSWRTTEPTTPQLEAESRPRT